MKNESKNKSAGTLIGFVWSLAERFMSQGVTLIVSVILSRLLDPSHYGVVSVVSVFTTFAMAFVSAGFGTALVQQLKPTEEDYDTVFFTTLSTAIVLYGVLFFTAPVIAVYYEKPEVTGVLRLMGLSLPLSSLSIVQYAFLQKHLQFKKYAVVTLISSALSGVVGIVLAYRGFGAYALAWQSPLRLFFATVLMMFVCKWRPTFRFSRASFRRIFPFSVKVFGSTLLMDLESDIRGLVIGKKYSTEDLAYYDKGQTFPKMLVVNFNGAISRVLFPVFANHQDDRETNLQIIRRSVRLQTFCIAPMLVGLMATARSMTVVLFTEKWLPSVPFIYILAVSYMLRPYENTCKEALLGIGKSGLFLLDMLITKAVSVAVLVAAVVFTDNVQLIAVGNVIATAVSILLYSFQISKYYSYTIRDQLTDSVGSYLCAVIMGVSASAVALFGFNPLITLILQVATGVAVYVGAAWLFRLSAMKDMLAILRSRRKGGKKA